MVKTSIRNKLIVLLLLVTIVPFGSAIFVTYIYTKESLNDQAIQTNLNLLYQGKVNIEGYLSELNNHTLSIYRNVDFMKHLKISPFPYDYLAQRVISNMLLTILYADDDIQRVSLSGIESTSLVTASRRSSVAYFENVIDPNQENNLVAKVSPYNLYIKSNPQSKEKGLTSFTLHRSIVNVPSSEVLGFISLEVVPRKVGQLSKHLYDEGKEEFYIFTPEGNVVYSSQYGVKTENAFEPWGQKLLEASELSGSIIWNDENFHGVIVYETISPHLGGWMLVKRLPYHTLHESAYGVAMINIVFGVIGIFIAVLATLFVSYKITSPIRILVKNIRQVEKGNMQAKFQSLGSDEIGVLGERFKIMMERINKLIDREYKLELENKTNQLKVLQSQINPHFLYNTLQSIGTMALKSKNKEVYSALTDLSQIMRYGMNTDEGVVSLVKEVNYIKAYLLLQRQRFSDDFEYILDVEEDVLDVKVPKMTLQPIIENYFKHGFHANDGVGKLTIECKRKESTLLIKIRDNGTGVSEERLCDIVHHLNAEHNRGREDTNIGLKNVYVRLKLYYSNKATFELQNLDEGGFLVTMKLPLEIGGSRDEGNHR
ncbi:histidine kinase [Anaerobacillus alkalidiazotrophicus]|uniref:Histidine kinase n=1 Tax=Anaerobacillus alkalidiazotrophicus TaxID=472963 RepID=A0A1S2MC15_9BACI|nr:sensor histidine kinase [Anaerobacillus alkalidiazotrophicus]OIJ22288.1 histidine kinase [Anaerobacillus alkalidiazotrophicus]